MSIATCIWFQRDMKVALARYLSLFPDSELISSQQLGGEHPAELAQWRMLGASFRGICAPSNFEPNEAVSLSITCADQAEVDRYWYGLLDGGGLEAMCGWLRDPWGVWWQIVPDALGALLADPVAARAQAARQQLFTQRRIVIAELQAAADAA